MFVLYFKKGNFSAFATSKLQKKTLIFATIMQYCKSNNLPKLIDVTGVGLPNSVFQCEKQNEKWHPWRGFENQEFCHQPRKNIACTICLMEFVGLWFFGIVFPSILFILFFVTLNQVAGDEVVLCKRFFKAWVCQAFHYNRGGRVFKKLSNWHDVINSSPLI